MKLIGTVVYFDPIKKFGFVTGKNENGMLERFYTNASYLCFCEVEIADIKAGHFVRFNVSPIPPKKQDGLRVALDLEVRLATPTLAALDVLSGKTSTTEARQ